MRLVVSFPGENTIVMAKGDDRNVVLRTGDTLLYDGVWVGAIEHVGYDGATGESIHFVTVDARHPNRASIVSLLRRDGFVEATLRSWRWTQDG